MRQDDHDEDDQRIVEPTSGRITLDGEDVTRGDADQLRCRIGYVIQRIGLFPHMTIAQKTTTVPRLLGKNKSRIDALLEVGHMPPAQYRDRHPKELFGGRLQAGRVARAPSGDPDVMLMDEPFAASDPIVRKRRQNEFLRLQSHVSKTTVFVTHDFDEAVRTGDRFVNLQEGSRIARYGMPELILTAPANGRRARLYRGLVDISRINQAARTMHRDRAARSVDSDATVRT